MKLPGLLSTRINRSIAAKALQTANSQLIHTALNGVVLLTAVLTVSSVLGPMANAAPPRPVMKTVPVGDYPLGLAFDGENAWVANTNDSTVTKIRASDGAVLATYPGGDYPIAAAFDGTDIWLLSFADASLFKLRTSDGTIIQRVRVGLGSQFILFDGSNVWTSNLDDKTLTKVRASDGEVLGTFPVADPGGMAFDGENIWVANAYENTVTKLRADDGVILDIIRAGTHPTHITFDGKNIWVADSGEGRFRDKNNEAPGTQRRISRSIYRG
jgi:DNA-binding beta-propeller fold protein YncE